MAFCGQVFELFVSYFPREDPIAFDSTHVADPYEEYVRIAIAHKVIHPEKPLPDVPAHVMMNVSPMPSLLREAQNTLDNIQKLFPLEVVDRIRVYGTEASKR